MLACLAISLFVADPPKPAAAWTPKDKETVVLLGSAFIEQEARDGYLETELIRLFPNKDIRVRNLGWSGDTVHCQARSYFGPPDEGFERLRGQLQMIKPTTVICCYGANESWKGEPGIPDFRKGYERLIDMIRQTTGATVVLMTPPPFGAVGYWIPPKAGWLEQLPAANERLSRYSQEIKYVADAKKASFWQLGGPIYPLTWNGVTWTPAGYEYLAKLLFPELSSEERVVQCGFHDASVMCKSAEIRDVRRQGRSLSWTMQLHSLPKRGPEGQMLGVTSNVQPVSLVNSGFDSPVVTLKIDDKPIIVKQGFLKSFLGLPYSAPDYQQSDQLRRAIIKKNALFFHRWRPANETYLYGFRKHEQGNNGVEPPQFDKLVEQAEAEIARLKKPVSHKYELIRVEEKK